MSNRIGLKLRVYHFPPGTSKWHKIEHRMFSHITQDWLGKPLVSHEEIVQLMAHTPTTAGLKFRAALDHRLYPTGEKVSRTEFENIQLKRANFHGDWNDAIKPR